ncbi:hypothetical protein W97_08726 [Coniosporium apollinis CBS 100218]|uniref:Carboxylic ester hydrolase n=1 Tax=Coniosporium apollinis (strain CBS 100218) TaxID=1168221 RepID=R7Z6A6_CONA1|nr:uncharacterized protein W97_08726 [Coniosporium apollinis CBS 100218]EON69466.1 hypothetical protein W97_08726 [Coniosporium apollinis CBS 100218]
MRSWLSVNSFTALVALCSFQVKADDGASPTARLDSGPIVGTTTALPSATAVVNKFLGVPFAVSPPERFSPPQRARRHGVLNTTAWKSACIQQFNYPEASRNFTISTFNTPAPEESEDCLYLNVYAPAAPARGAGRAVMVWIYGGSLRFGTAGQRTYDGSYFAAYEDVIVVTVNYRTNVFGFPASPELPLIARNLGFLDQRLGLDWVQRNARAFGGDPSRVTIFGESAGAFSIDALLTSFPKGSKPPFQAAILQSGQYSYRTTPTVSSSPAWNNLTAALNCTGPSALACARAAPASVIKNIIERGALQFDPVPDNLTLVSRPAQRRISGNIADVPVLSGTTSQEGRVFVVGQTNITNYVRTTFRSAPVALQDAILAAYPVGGEYPTGYDAIAQIFTEFVFQCPQALFANATAAIGIPSWRYYFNATFPNLQRFPNAGVYHASEIAMVFRTYNMSTATAEQDALGKFMQGVWAQFAKNPHGGPGWNAVGTGDEFIGGAADLDLGVIGGQGWAGVKVIRESEVDGRCALFRPIYEATTGLTIGA